MLKLRINLYNTNDFLSKYHITFIKKYFFVHFKKLFKFSIISVKTYNYFKNCIKFCVVNLPTRLQPITLLRSPHVFKKSKEKFIRKHYKSLILFQFLDFVPINFILLLNSILFYFLNFIPAYAYFKFHVMEKRYLKI